jgi:hypothetical protein
MLVAPQLCEESHDLNTSSRSKYFSPREQTPAQGSVCMTHEAFVLFLSFFRLLLILSAHTLWTFDMWSYGCITLPAICKLFVRLLGKPGDPLNDSAVKHKRPSKDSIFVLLHAFDSILLRDARLIVGKLEGRAIEEAGPMSVPQGLLGEGHENWTIDLSDNRTDIAQFLSSHRMTSAVSSQDIVPARDMSVMLFLFPLTSRELAMVPCLPLQE